MGNAKRSERDVEETRREGAAVPDSEVLEKAQRRRFPAEYKLRVLREADACTEPGEIGALLRREGLYASHLSVWKRQREEGSLSALGPKKRGRRAKPMNPLSRRVEELEREIGRVRGKLKQAETIIEVQKKVSEILQLESENSQNEGSE